ncbi:hypothetical protein GCM10029964_008880 [Kibdelosporangium lantanae]
MVRSLTWTSVTQEYRPSPVVTHVKRLSTGQQVQLLPAVPAAGREHVHVPLAPRAGAQRPLQEVVLRTATENPNASAHADQRCPPTPGKGKLITPFVAGLIATLHTP